MCHLSYMNEFNDNLLMLLVQKHSRYRPIVEFFDRMTRELAELSWVQAEQIAQAVSEANRSTFCNGIRRGMTRVLQGNGAGSADGKLSLLIEFALKVNRDASAIGQQDVNTLVDAGWREQTVEDVVGLVAIQKLYNTLAAALGFRALPERAFVEIAQDTVNKGGYTASFDAFVQFTQAARR